MASVVRWAMLAVLLGVCLLAAEGAPGEERGEHGTLASVSASKGVTQGRMRRSTDGDENAASSDYNNDEAGDYDEDGTGEEEEESSPPPPPKFLSAPVTYNMRPGDDVSLPCKVDDIGKMIQMWLNGTQVITVREQVMGDKDRIERLPNMSLIIRNVKPEDSGAYTCQIVSQPLANLTHFVRVPAPSKIISHSQKQTVTLGNPLTLNCSVWGSPQPSVKWTLQNREVPDATYSEGGSILTVRVVAKHHEGHYKCIADNGAGQPAEATIVVNVATKPQVTVVKSMIYSGEGETVELACTVTGLPKPQVKWLKEGKEVEIGSSRFGVNAVNNTYILRIKNMEKTDFGIYSCSAKNKFGNRQKNITISGMPDVPKYRGSRIEDKKIILQWDVESSAPIQNHEMKYRKQGEEEWIVVSPVVKDADGNIYRVEVELEDLPAGEYEALLHSQNEFGWGKDSPVEHFQGSEKHNHEDESPSIEEKPAAETSKRGPDGSGATICSISSITAAVVATLIFRTLFNHL